MSSSVAPLFPKTSVFIPAYWATARSETLTQEEADTRYLRFPVGQGTESIPNLIVAGTSTLGITSTNALTSTTTISATGVILSNEEIVCLDSGGNSAIDIFPNRITGYATGYATMNLSMEDGFTYTNTTTSRSIYTDPNTATTLYSAYSGGSPTPPLLTIGLDTTPSCILQAEYSVGDSGLFTIRNFNADDQYSYTTLTTGDDAGTSPIATIGINDPTFGSTSFIAVDNTSMNFFCNNAYILTLGSNTATFTSQLTLPNSPSSATFATGVLTCDLGSASTGIFTGVITANMTGISFTNARRGGQYVIYITATGGTRTIASTLTGTTNKTNYTSAISVLTTSVALLTITYDGTRLLIAGSAYN
jgi:hypothetical protein